MGKAEFFLAVLMSAGLLYFLLTSPEDSRDESDEAIIISEFADQPAPDPKAGHRKVGRKLPNSLSSAEHEVLNDKESGPDTTRNHTSMRMR